MAALFGGYAISALATAALSLLLPRILGAGRADAVLAATLASFVWYTVVVIWVFTTRSAWRAWAGVVSMGLVLGLSLLLTRWP